MNRFEKNLRAVEEAMREKVNHYQGILTLSDEEDRDLTPDERIEIEKDLKAIETLKVEKKGIEEEIATLQRVKDIGKEIGPAFGNTSVMSGIQVGSEPEDRLFQRLNQHVFPQAQKSIGQQFVDSQGYKAMREVIQQRGGLPDGYTTGPMAIEMKGTLLEGAGSPGAGSGGGLIPVPAVVPGVVETLFQPLHIASLLLEGQTSGNTVRYVVEGTATSGAAGVAEAGSKPESTLGIGTKDEPIKKIATFLPVADEMLEDAPAIQSYINGRLMLFVRIEEERQLCRGASGGNEVQGILTSRSVPVFAGGTADNKAVQMFKAMNSMRGSAFLEPEWIVMHPTDFQIIRLLTDTAGQFFGGGPFLGAYNGQGPMADASNQIGPSTDTLWGKPLYVTAAVGGAGTALIGTRANAQVWRRGGISIEASNSHSTYFQFNLLAVRAEERLGLALYRSGGYVEARLAVGPGG